MDINKKMRMEQLWSGQTDIGYRHSETWRQGRDYMEGMRKAVLEQLVDRNPLMKDQIKAC
jgi:hypothetical protein